MRIAAFQFRQGADTKDGSDFNSQEIQMSNIQAISQQLLGTPLFKSFTAVEMEQFMTVSDPVEFKSGEFIVRQDESGDCMFCLAEGTTKVISNRERRQVEFARLGPGAIFGELALFERRPRFADVIAVTDCVLLKVSEAMIHAFASLYPAAAYKLMAGIIREISTRLRATNARVLDSLLPTVPPAQG